MKKIGILTHYYKTKNYGGSLQAYALCKVLNSNGYNAEQICYVLNNNKPVKNKSLKQKIKEAGLFGSIFKASKVLMRKLNIKQSLVLKDKAKNNVTFRQEQAFKSFLENDIPNSKIVYNDENISTCTNNYDAFITGSDQVWNLRWYRPPFFLDFVPSTKIKMSYSASIAMTSLTSSQKHIFKESLKDFKAVSLRECSEIPLISDLSPVKPIYTLDPTLLLDKNEWDSICDKRIIDEDYVFCYFLGNNKKERQIAKKFAKSKNLKLVNIPYAGNTNEYFNVNFGDIKLYDVSPNKFISLIKHANYVFTDSFHASVFSLIYEKQFFVFNRDKKGSMNDRIKDLTNLFDVKERFCDFENENLEYVNSLKDIDYSKNLDKFIELKKQSIKFLEDNLGGLKNGK